MNISFNKPPVLGTEIEYIAEAINQCKLSGDGSFTKKCSEWFEKRMNCKKVFLTTSATSALDMAAILSGVGSGDEVIMPSYTFVSTANAFALRGAKIIFIDVRPDTMNIDEKLIESAITKRTKVIVPVHYAGVSCDMDMIMDIAKKYDLLVIEDAAQGVMSKYKGRYLGTIGHLGAFSFHETKNYTCGEGGALLINDKRFIERAEIIREKGTNRSKFFRGETDKYTWVDIGSSYLPSELNAAYLYGQLKYADKINENRLVSWKRYYNTLKPLKQSGIFDLPVIPDDCEHNGHMFFIKLKNINVRQKLIDFLKERGIYTVFHYIPLHSSPAGRQYGKFCGVDRFTTIDSERLLRLPMYYKINDDDIDCICATIKDFFIKPDL